MEQPYRQYFQDMPCYLTVQDRDLKIINGNQRFIDDFGNYEGRYCYQVYKQRSEPCEICPVEQTFRDGQSHSSQERVTCLDGKDVEVIVYTTPVRDESGKITSVMEMSTDITDIKRLQNQLRDSQQRYHLLFEEVPCYISIQDRDLNILDTNRRFRDDFGSHLGCKCFEIYKHRDDICLECPVQETFVDGEVHHSEEVVTSRNGEQINTLVYAAPIYDPDGQINRVMEMSANITPIRELQSQLESIGLLISSVSHGIKGLLNGLDGGMYLVNTGMEKGDDKRLKKGWEMVQRNVERIRAQVLNILYYAKEREPNYENIQVAAALEEVANMVEPKAMEHNVAIEQNTDATAGALDVDPNALRSMLVNLAENSVDACRVDQRKTEHRVILSANGDADSVYFQIADNGIGMDQETREKAFSLFFSSKGAKGTGLGLFVANKITTAHGGRIEIESEPNQGAKFIVTLPRSQVRE